MTTLAPKRAVTVIVVAACVVALGTVLAVVVARHGAGVGHRPGPSGANLDSGAEDTFVAVTAAHLCQVGQTVYDNPKALADAYRSPPPYPGLTARQVADLTGRLRTDQALSARMTRQLQATCHRTAPS